MIEQLVLDKGVKLGQGSETDYSDNLGLDDVFCSEIWILLSDSDDFDDELCIGSDCLNDESSSENWTMR